MNSLVLKMALLAGFLWCTACENDSRDAASDTSETKDTGGVALAPGIPSSCDAIQKEIDEGRIAPSTVGCEFYVVNLDAFHHRDPRLAKTPDVGLGVANPHEHQSATVTIWRNYPRTGWRALDSLDVAPLAAGRLDVPDDYHLESLGWEMEGSGVNRAGALKITSTVPIISFQSSPLGRELISSTDGSTLIPVGSLDYVYEAFGIGGYFKSSSERGNSLSYLAVVATKDQTTITVKPSVPLKAEGGVPDNTLDKFQLTVDEGDVLYLHPDDPQDSIGGTLVQSDPDHPLAVFSGHQCVNIPKENLWCDHLEEQLPGLRFWGTHFIASRFPTRKMLHGKSDPVFWQIIAAEDNTRVVFGASDNVVMGHEVSSRLQRVTPEERGIVSSEIPSAITMSQGDIFEFYTQGEWGTLEDFVITTEPADEELDPNTQEPRAKPIAVMQYMSGSEWTAPIPLEGVHDGEELHLGDPAMAYLSPVEQFLPRHVLLVPGDWFDTTFVITRKKGAAVLYQGTPIDDKLFLQVSDSEYETARVKELNLAGMSTFIIESKDRLSGIGVLVVGMDHRDSYAYFGGMGLRSIYTPAPI